MEDFARALRLCAARATQLCAMCVFFTAAFFYARPKCLLVNEGEPGPTKNRQIGLHARHEEPPKPTLRDENPRTAATSIRRRLRGSAEMVVRHLVSRKVFLSKLPAW